MDIFQEAGDFDPSPWAVDHVEAQNDEQRNRSRSMLAFSAAVANRAKYMAFRPFFWGGQAFFEGIWLILVIAIPIAACFCA
jgi:hypothetical protein